MHFSAGNPRQSLMHLRLTLHCYPYPSCKPTFCRAKATDFSKPLKISIGSKSNLYQIKPRTGEAVRRAGVYALRGGGPDACPVPQGSLSTTGSGHTALLGMGQDSKQSERREVSETHCTSSRSRLSAFSCSSDLNGRARAGHHLWMELSGVPGYSLLEKSIVKTLMLHCQHRNKIN